MKERLRAIASRVFVEKWIDHGFYEVLLMRIFFAGVIYDSINWTRTFSDFVKPNGLARLEVFQQPLLWFGDAANLAAVRTWIWVPLICYAIGLVPIPAIVSLLVVTVSVGTLESSDGGIGHSYQIVSLILLAQLASHIYCSRKHPDPAGTRTWLLPSLTTQNHSIHLAKVTIAAAYVVCGVAKLIKSDFLWIQKVPLLSVQITKANLRDYYNTLEPKTDFVSTEIPRLVVEYPNIARIFFGAGLFLELFAFLALRGRAWAMVMGIALITMHFFIDQIMALTFWTHMHCLAIFYVNIPFAIMWAVTRFRGTGTGNVEN